jgi:hypothetical protein
MLLKESQQNNIITSYYNSSNILKSIYDINRRELYITFSGGRQYLYEGVVSYHYSRFKVGDSIGKNFKEHILKNYSGVRIENMDEETLKQLKEDIIIIKK